MSGQDGAHERVLEKGAERGGRDAHLARAMESEGERARTRRGRRDSMRAIAADVMLILGDIGEMREIAEGRDDRERLVGAETVEGRLQLPPGAGLVVAMEADRGLPDLFDQLEGLLALLLAHGVAENAAEEPNVVAKGAVLVRVVVVMELLREGHDTHPSAGAAMLHCGRG